MQYTKSFKVNDFFNQDTENENSMPNCKKRRIRSPLKPLPTTPKKSSTFLPFPCSKSMTSPRKNFNSPRKIIFSPKKLFSPTVNLPNFVKDGKSPHQPIPKSASTKKIARNWLTEYGKSQKIR